MTELSHQENLDLANVMHEQATTPSRRFKIACMLTMASFFLTITDQPTIISQPLFELHPLFAHSDTFLTTISALLAVKFAAQSHTLKRRANELLYQSQLAESEEELLDHGGNG